MAAIGNQLDDCNVDRGEGARAVDLVGGHCCGLGGIEGEYLSIEEV